MSFVNYNINGNYGYNSTALGGVTSSSTTANTATTTTGFYYNSYAPKYTNSLAIPGGSESRITLPNGAILQVNADGSYEINDSGRITYKGCKVREFNRFINASDLLEDFIRFMGTKFNIKQNEILEIPIDMFITWLIMRACQEDGDEIPPDVMKIEDHSFVKKTKIKPRCKCCGRFISKKYSDNNVFFCNSKCVDKLIKKI